MSFGFHAVPTNKHLLLLLQPLSQPQSPKLQLGQGGTTSSPTIHVEHFCCTLPAQVRQQQSTEFALHQAQSHVFFKVCCSVRNDHVYHGTFHFWTTKIRLSTVVALSVPLSSLIQCLQLQRTRFPRTPEDPFLQEHENASWGMVPERVIESVVIISGGVGVLSGVSPSIDLSKKPWT